MMKRFPSHALSRVSGESAVRLCQGARTITALGKFAENSERKIGSGCRMPFKFFGAHSKKVDLRHKVVLIVPLKINPKENN